MNKKIPEKVLKWVSASIFAICGLIGYIEASRKLLGQGMIIFSTILIVFVGVAIALVIVKSDRNGKFTKEFASIKGKRIVER